jgi:hypothetical protein
VSLREKRSNPIAKLSIASELTLLATTGRANAAREFAARKTGASAIAIKAFQKMFERVAQTAPERLETA